MERMRRGAAATLLIGWVLVALLGCGGGKPQPAGTTRVTMSDFAFQPNSISLPAGRTTFFLVNSAMDAHDMVVEDRSSRVVGRSPSIAAGDAATFTIQLAAGTYTFYCDIPGHRDAGMTGTLTVS